MVTWLWSFLEDRGAAELYWFYRSIYKTDFAVYINAINAAEMFL